MGTTFANLQIRSNAISEIESVVPDSIIRTFSDGWTTIVSERFQVGEMDKAAKKLSKGITQSVVSIEYFDDDLLKMSIYRNGKALSTHLSGGEGYGLSRKLGKPDVFIEELGFDSSEVKYLKAILACENLGKKMEMLQHFLGVTIWINHQMLLEDSEADYRCQRDLTVIDHYLEERSKKKQIKNRTKANLLQEFEGTFMDILGDCKFHMGIPPYDSSNDCYASEEIYSFTPDGTLEPTLEITSFHHRSGNSRLIAAHGRLSFFCPMRGKYYVFDDNGNKVSETTIRDSLDCPIRMLEDGGYLTVTYDQHVQMQFLKGYSSSLEMRWQIPCEGFPYFHKQGIYLYRSLTPGQSSELVKLNRSGQVAASIQLNYEGHHGPYGRFLFDKTGKVIYWCNATASSKWLTKIFILTEQLELIRQYDLEGISVETVAVDSQNQRLFLLSQFNNEFLVMDMESPRIISRKELMGDSDLCLLTVDSFGRAVVLIGDSTIGIIDENLNDVSRHRLKGHVRYEFINNRGNLCLLTGTGGAHDGDGTRGMTIRVYEICNG